jgi:hypothetical protein
MTPRTERGKSDFGYRNWNWKVGDQQNGQQSTE